MPVSAFTERLGYRCGEESPGLYLNFTSGIYLTSEFSGTSQAVYSLIYLPVL